MEPIVTEYRWERSFGTDGNKQPCVRCEDCGKPIRKGAWELVNELIGRSYCRRCGWPRWDEATKDKAFEMHMAASFEALEA